MCVCVCADLLYSQWKRLEDGLVVEGIASNADNALTVTTGGTMFSELQRERSRYSYCKDNFKLIF